MMGGFLKVHFLTVIFITTTIKTIALHFSFAIQIQSIILIHTTGLWQPLLSALILVPGVLHHDFVHTRIVITIFTPLGTCKNANHDNDSN